MLFHKRDDFKKVIYKKITFRVKNKNKFTKNKQTFNKMIDNNSKFLSTIMSNRKIVKFIFFKNSTKQKNITKFLINVSKKNNHFLDRVSNFLFFVLIQSHFFFFINDINFFLKNKFIFVNNKNVFNKFFELKVNDCVKLINFNSYFDYLSNIYKFFKKKKSKIKYKRWVGFKLQNKTLTSKR